MVKTVFTKKIKPGPALQAAGELLALFWEVLWCNCAHFALQFFIDECFEL